ncbi:hypothetical protein R6Z07F_008571 [Ovis aries]
MHFNRTPGRLGQPQAEHSVDSRTPAAPHLYEDSVTGFTSGEFPENTHPRVLQARKEQGAFLRMRRDAPQCHWELAFE